MEGDSQREKGTQPQTAPRTLPYQPQYQYHQRHYNPQDLRTNYQSTFTPQRMELPPHPSMLENVGNRIVSHVPFTGGSSYKEQFKPFAVKPTLNPQQLPQPRQKVQQPYPSPAKFQGVSAYKAQFVDPPKVQLEPVPEQVYRKVHVPFYGSSSYKEHFPKFHLDKSVVQPDSNRYERPTVRFEGSTSYHDHFKGYNSMVVEPQRESVDPGNKSHRHAPDAHNFT